MFQFFKATYLSFFEVLGIAYLPSKINGALSKAIWTKKGCQMTKSITKQSGANLLALLAFW
jgi:hypothetical protein